MNKNLFTIGFLTLAAIVFFVVWGLKQPESVNAPSEDTSNAEIVYYYGQECPHCQNVQKFIDENKVNERLTFAKKEVWHNKDNAAELDRKAKECNIEKSGMGVPFLYSRGKCYVGEQDVVNFFKKEARL